MTESSKFWDGTTVGDATVSPYDANSEFAEVLKAIAYTNSLTNQGGVFRSYINELLPIIAGASVQIVEGGAFVDGTFYKNDNAVTFAIATPSGATRIDRVVLRKDWTAQTVRLALVAGVEGGGEPTLTQTPGVTWDIPIVKASITTGGVITITDEREFLGTNGLVGASHAPMTNFVLLSPPVAITHASLSTGGGTIALPSAVPPKAIAVAIQIDVGGVTPGVGDGGFSVGDASITTIPSLLARFANGEGTIAGVAALTGGTPCTFTYDLIASAPVTVIFSVTGYWEPIN